MDDILQRIQTEQFTDKQAAERLLLDFVRQTFSLDVASVELRPLAVSLNSFNGFLTLSDGARLFFKTHVEQDNVIGEYYQAAMLAQAGYPVIQPLYSSTRAGRQLLIYEAVEDPSVFDVAWAVETGTSADLPALTQAQHAGDDRLLQIYLDTLEWQSATEAGGAAIHQLFYHRLVGGRLERFYGPLPGRVGKDVSIALPGGAFPLRQVRRVTWRINGSTYETTLDQIIQNSIGLLIPDVAGPSILGHGDAHNGNLFFRREDKALVYFDPAFAGRHHPLLDLVKPMFHNVFAMWMYFPQQKRDKLNVKLRTDGHLWRVEHDYTLPPVREMFLYSKVERVLIPVLQELKRRGWLRADWTAFLKAALFCCPFLTMNLADPNRFPAEISLLGLAMAVEMGAESAGQRSAIDRILDDANQALL